MTVWDSVQNIATNKQFYWQKPNVYADKMLKDILHNFCDFLINLSYNIMAILFHWNLTKNFYFALAINLHLLQFLQVTLYHTVK